MSKTFLIIILLVWFIQNACNPEPGNKIHSRAAAKEIEEDQVSADGKDSLQKLAENIFTGDIFTGASYSFVLFDPEKGDYLVRINPALNLLPASVTKIITTAAALEILGAGYRFETKLYFTGKITGHKLLGDIIIQGGGDPTLGSIKFHSAKNRYEFLNKWVRAIRKAGIDTIDGNIIADASVFDEEAVPTAWQWEDIAAYYGTAATGLSVFDNRFSLTFDPHKKQTYYPRKTECSPYIPGLSITNNIRFTDGDYYLDILGAYFNHNRVIKGVVPGNKTRLTISASIPDPPLLVARYLEMYLVNNGIAVYRTATTSRILKSEGKEIDYSEAKLITTTFSPALLEIVKNTNKESNNLFAGHLFKMTGYKMTKWGGVDSGVAAINDYFLSKKVIASPLRLYDGCGISRKNNITANQLVNILDYMLKSKNASGFIASLPVSGTDGTLINFCGSEICKGKVMAKSGSMAGVRTYAGYMLTGSGKKMVFAVMVNNFNDDSKKINKKLEEMLSQCIKYIESK